MSEMEQVRSAADMLSDQFKTQGLRVAEVAAKVGLTIAPYHDASLPSFRALSETQQRFVVKNLRNLAESYEQVKGPPADPGTILEQLADYLDRAGLAVDPEIFRQIDENDYVDIYSLDHHLAYASLNFLSMLSYSLEDIFCNHWELLYSRDSADIVPQLQSVVQSLVSGEHKEMLDISHIKNHVGYELRSPKRRAAAVIPKFVAPLFSNDKFAGYVCVTTIAMIEGEFTWK